MAADNNSDSVIRIQSIAQTAISQINHLVSLVEQRGAAATAENVSLTEQRSLTASESQASTSSIEPQRSTPRAGTSNALEELRRRFPTLSRGTGASRARDPSTGRYERSCTSRPYPSVRRSAGRPLASEVVSKDVIILEIGREKVPTKSQKPELESSGRIISGFDINRKWDAKTLHQELSTLLTGELEGMYFEIVKNCGGTLLRPNLPRGKEIDSKLLLKSIAPSGCLYLRLLEELPASMLDPSDKLLEASPFAFEVERTEVVCSSDSASGEDNLLIDLTQQIPLYTSHVGSRLSEQNLHTSADLSETNAGSVLSVSDSQSSLNSFDINSIISHAKAQGLSDPVEVLKFLQKEIVTGRQLEVTNCDETIEGETNYITVDRDGILETTFSELRYITNYRFTFQVDFMGEECVDQGGPRKEWIRLMNQAIKEKYFDQGLRPLLAQDYFFVGIMMAVAMLQNGQLPVFVEESILQQIVSSEECSDPCVRQIQQGLEELGMLSAFQQLPMLVYLLRPQALHKMSVPMLLQILKPQFSEEGSNALKKEKEVYQLFVKYVREVAASRRVCGETTLDLSHILQFATASAEEPVLGFKLAPSLEFILPTEIKATSQQGSSEEEHPSVEGGFLPLAHTCTNVLELPRPTNQIPLPPMERLFTLYDLAFSQPFFGKK